MEQDITKEHLANNTVALTIVYGCRLIIEDFHYKYILLCALNSNNWKGVKDLGSMILQTLYWIVRKETMIIKMHLIFKYDIANPQLDCYGSFKMKQWLLKCTKI